MKMRHSLSLLLLCGLAVSGTASAQAEHGHVYVASNGDTANEIAVLKRAADGSLSVIGKYATGGIGSGAGTTVAFDPLGSKNSVLITSDLRWLLVTNAGSNQVSVFRIDGDTLTLVDVVDSGGEFPVSVTQRGDLVYVLNSGAKGNISGFRLSWRGTLSPIPGASIGLNLDTPYIGATPDALNAPTQVQFTPDGRYLFMDSKKRESHGSLWTFKIGPDGALSQARTQPAVDPLPFGFIFDKAGRLLISQAGFGTLLPDAPGSLVSYRVLADGSLKLVSYATTPNARVSCWVDQAGPWLYTTDTLGGTISLFREAPDGSLTISDVNGGIAATLGPDIYPLDFNISEGERFLNVQLASDGTVLTYAINYDDGSLSLLSKTPVFGPLSGMQGIAAY